MQDPQTYSGEDDWDGLADCCSSAASDSGEAPSGQAEDAAGSGIVLRIVGPGDDEPLAKTQATGDSHCATEATATSTSGGPGDDEPLAPSCRGAGDGWLRLYLETDYSEAASVVIYASGRFLASRSLDSAGSEPAVDPASGLYRVPIDLDLASIQATLGRHDLLTPEGGVLDLDVALFSDPEREFLGARSWRQDVHGRPWIEFLPGTDDAGLSTALSGGEEGEQSSLQVQMVLYPPSGDSFFLVLASFRYEDLSSPPGSSQTLARAVVLDAGPLSADGQSLVQTVDSPSTSTNAFPYVVLWTYDDLEGWSSSAVYAVP